MSSSFALLMIFAYSIFLTCRGWHDPKDYRGIYVALFGLGVQAIVSAIEANHP